MAHWAQIDENNIVTQITIGNNDDPDEGYSWLIDNLGGRWIKTSYNTIGGIHTQGGIPLRKNYAGVGFYYDEERDAFIPPKPQINLDPESELFSNIADWVLNEETCLWEPINIQE